MDARKRQWLRRYDVYRCIWNRYWAAWGLREPPPLRTLKQFKRFVRAMNRAIRRMEKMNNVELIV